MRRKLTSSNKNANVVSFHDTGEIKLNGFNVGMCYINDKDELGGYFLDADGQKAAKTCDVPPNTVLAMLQENAQARAARRAQKSLKI